MKKLLKLIGVISLFSTPVLTVSCSKSEDNSLEAKINKIIDFREIGHDYKYLENWHDLLLRNSKKLNSYLINFNYGIQNEAIRWKEGKDVNLKNTYEPLEQVILTSDNFKNKILIDFELPYGDETTPFSGIPISASNLEEEEFFQIYNYQTLKTEGYEITVESSNVEVIEVIDLDENGAIHYKGTKKTGEAVLKITASKAGVENLEKKINVSNLDHKNSGFLQWRAFQFLRYNFANGETMQLMMACFLVQIYAQMMYNASYNSNPNLETKTAVLDKKMLDMLYCFANYSFMVNYIEFWPGGDTILSGVSFYFSFNFYVHPVVKDLEQPQKEELKSNPVAKINQQLTDYATKTMAKYNEIMKEGN